MQILSLHDRSPINHNLWVFETLAADSFIALCLLQGAPQKSNHPYRHGGFHYTVRCC
jgi:hypothetical protein